MRHKISTAAAMLAAALVLLPAVPALAGYGAIAWDKESGKRGWSWNEATSQKAADVALSECGASGCKVIMRTGARACAALATTADGKFVGAAARKSQDTARLAALANCQKGKAGDCVVRTSDCNK
jgi:serine/threonine-protein kinase